MIILPNAPIYSIYPAVVPADKQITMTICANEPAFIIPDGRKYSLNIINVNCDENYYNPSNHKWINIVCEKGVLRFEFMFEGEGEHMLWMMQTRFL